MLKFFTEIQEFTLFFALGISILYCGFILIKFGLLRSVSISYYSLEYKWRILFKLYIWLLSASVIILGNDWVFLVSGLIFSLIAVTPTTKDKPMLIWHFTFALISIITMILWLWLNYGYWHPTAIVGTLLIVYLIFFREISILLTEYTVILSILGTFAVMIYG